MFYVTTNLCSALHHIREDDTSVSNAIRRKEEMPSIHAYGEGV